MAEMLGFDRIRRAVIESRMKVAGVVAGNPTVESLYALQPITRQLAEANDHRGYPMMQTTTPVLVAGGVTGGALPMSAGRASWSPPSAR
jgi:hypothetical protein